jgi:serine protease Do
MMNTPMNLLLILILFSFPFQQNCTKDSQESPQPLLSAPITQPADRDTLPESVNLNAAITNSRETAITSAVREASPSIVSITVTEIVEERGNLQFDPFYGFFLAPSQREFNSMGSGFIISRDGLVVTNEHVATKNAKRIVISMQDGSMHEAEVLGVDELVDLALLKIKSEENNFPFIQFSNSDEVMVGEWAIAMGNPFGLFDAGQPSVTVGVVSATKRDFRPDPDDPRVYIDMIQTDAAINMGNSGGPLLNSEGDVIGVNTFIYTGGGRGNVGLGFAIPSNRVIKIVEQLKTSGAVALDYDPGLDFTPMTRALVYKYGLPSIQGLLVTSVNKDGPAYDCGIMPGDIILKIGSERVSSEMHAWALLREYQEGEEMPIELLRKNQRYKTKMLLKKSIKG